MAGFDRTAAALLSDDACHIRCPALDLLLWLFCEDTESFLGRPRFFCSDSTASLLLLLLPAARASASTTAGGAAAIAARSGDEGSAFTIPWSGETSVTARWFARLLLPPSVAQRTKVISMFPSLLAAGFDSPSSPASSVSLAID